MAEGQVPDGRGTGSWHKERGDGRNDVRWMMAEVCGEQGNGSINYLIDNESWKIEREADGFASKLLMPENCIKAFVSERELYGTTLSRK